MSTNDNSATQVAHPGRATLRTVFQILIALAAGWALVIEALGLDPGIPWVAATLAFAAGVTRLMALPFVESLLRQYVPWLAAQSPGALAALDDDDLEEIEPDPEDYFPEFESDISGEYSQE